ncbi:MAG: recombinase family protein [Ruminococcaceae bacterium]|nr:recombinase family protein [Oscillospiraceae bacterium]
MYGGILMKIAAYCRVSTGSENQLSSLENQKTFFEEYAKKNGYDLVEIYADKGISGKALKNRKAFSKMLSDSSKKVFDMLIVKDISRFARNTVDFLTGIRKLKSNGIDIRFLSCDMTVLGESEFALTMFAAIAQEESYNLSKRIIFGKDVSAKRGRTPSVIYGYDKDGTYSLSRNESELETVKEIFEMYTSKNMGIRKISSYLNEKHIPPKHGSKWHPKTVRRIISNPLYCGKLINNKTRTLDFMESTRKTLPKEENYIHQRPELAVISEDTFQMAMRILGSKTKKGDTNRNC